MLTCLFPPESLTPSQTNGFAVPDPACGHTFVEVLAWCRSQAEYSLSVFAHGLACDGCGGVQEGPGQVRQQPHRPWAPPPG